MKEGKKKRCENTDILLGESLEYAKNLEKNIDSVMEKINDYFESMKEIV